MKVLKDGRYTDNIIVIVEVKLDNGVLGLVL